MNKQKIEIINDAQAWFSGCGYDGDLSALIAGLFDIEESIQKIFEELLPSLLLIDLSNKENALGVIVDLCLKMEHIGRHADSSVESLIAIRDYLDTSAKPR